MKVVTLGNIFDHFVAFVQFQLLKVLVVNNYCIEYQHVILVLPI